MSDGLELNVEMSTSTAHRLMHYDGVCSCIHGHNIGWDVDVLMEYEPNYEDNMSVDFKYISDVIDTVDHALLINEADPIAEEYDDGDWTRVDGSQSNPVVDWSCYDTDKYGQLFVFDGDPTVEILSEWMLFRILENVDDAYRASAEVAETDKYAISRGVWEGKYE